MIGSSGQERERRPMTPGLLLIPIVRGKGMPRLSSGHMENAFALMTGGHNEPLTRSEAILHHANTLPASGRRFIRHVEEGAQSWQHSAEGVFDPYTIQMSPRHLAQRKRRMLRFQFPNTLLHRVQNKLRPTGKVIRIRIQFRELRRQEVTQGGVQIAVVAELRVTLSARGQIWRKHRA